MIIRKDKQAFARMTEAGKRLAHIFSDIASHIVPGVSTLELDALIEQKLKAADLVSQSKGYHSYRHVSCISVNDEVVHGIPMAHKKLQDGDLVKIDVCAAWQGYCADMARCFFVGSRSAAAQDLVDVARAALDKGIEQAVPGKHLSNISAAVQQEVEQHGYGVVRIFAGHGIGKKMHEAPEILNYGKPGRGPIIQPGMAFAIEPMITAGKFDVHIMADGWTAKTVDKSLAAHVEDTVLVTEHGPKIITRL